MTAAEVAAALAGPFEAAGWRADRCPLADGGEGTTEVLLGALGGELVTAAVHDPLGRPIDAAFAILGDGETVALDAAAASGLALVAQGDRNAEAASTRGTGELVVAAAATGARRIVVGVGDSATTDGGAGAIAEIESAGGLSGVRITCLCDVRSSWEEAAPVFAPQKGADPAAVARLSERLKRLAATLPGDPRGRPRTGAGGGLSGGLWARFGADLVSGAGYLMEAVGFDRRAAAAGLAVTGEGRLDGTSLEGKVVGQVAERCHALGVPVHAVVGNVAVEPAVLEALAPASLRKAGSEEELNRAAEEIRRSLPPGAPA